MERSTTGRNSKLQKRKNCLEILNELCAKTGLSHTWEESVAVETNSGKGPPFFFQQLTVTGNDNITEAELERVFKSKDPKRSKKDAQKASAELAVEWLRELSKQGSISVNWSEWNNEEDVQSRDEMRAAADQQHQEGSPLDPSSVGPLDHGMAGMATRSPVSMLKEMEDMTNKLTVNWGEARCESTISGKQDFYQPVTIALFGDDGSSKREEEEIKATTPQSTKKAAKRATAEEALKWLNARGLNLFALKNNDDDDDDDYGGVTPPNPIAPWLQGDDNKIRDGQNAEPREIQGTTQNGSSLDSALRGLSLGQPMPLLHGPASSTTYPEPTPKTATIPLPARDPTIEPAPSAPSSNRSTPHSEAAAVQPNDVTLATSLQVTPLANNLSDPGEPEEDDHLEARGAGESTLFSPPDAETEASTDPSLKIVVGVGEVKELESDGGNVEPGLVLHKDPQESNNHGGTSSSAVLVDGTCFSSALPEGVSAEFLNKPEMLNKQVVAVGGPAGDSLFAAVAAQLAQYAASVDSQGVWAGPHALRQDTAEHLRRNRDRFAQRFGEATKSSKSLFDQYIKKMSQDGYAGGSIEIAAMEEMLDYSFDIFLDKSECFDSFFTEEDQDDSMNNDATNDDSSTVQLSFHCNDRYHRVQSMQPDEVHSKEKLLPKRQTRHIQRNRGDQCLGHIECGNCHQIILAGDQLCLFKGSNLVTKLEYFEEHPSSYRTAPHPKSSSSEFVIFNLECECGHNLGNRMRNMEFQKVFHIDAFASGKVKAFTNDDELPSHKWGKMPKELWPWLEPFKEDGFLEKKRLVRTLQEKALPTSLAKDNLGICKENHFLDPKGLVRIRPFKYQVEMLGKCLDQNSIVVLPTGSGKTLVASMVIGSMKLLNPQKCILFVVDNIPLVYQQAEALSKNDSNGLKIRTFHGADHGKIKRRPLHMQNFDVLVVTGGALYDNILSSQPDFLAHVSVIIFDEAHKGVGNHLYCKIMKTYKDTLSERIYEGCHPLVLGLTASPINAKSKEAAPTKLAEIRDTYGNALFLSPTDHPVLEELQPKDMKEDHLLAKKSDLEQKVMQISFEFLRNLIAIIQKNQLLPISDDVKNRIINSAFTHEDSIDISLTTLLSFLSVENSALDIKTCDGKRVSRDIDNIKTVLEALRSSEIFGPSQLLDAMKDVHTALQYDHDNLGQQDLHVHRAVQHLVMTFVNDLSYLVEDSSNTAEGSISDRIKLLLRELNVAYGVEASEHDECKRQGDLSSLQETKTIIFVTKRSTAQRLSGYLAQKYRKYVQMKFDFVVGGKGIESMEPSVQKQKIEDLRCGKINVLVATNVVEEGIDIPDCNLVIRLQGCFHAIQMIQSRGRARADKARFVVIGNHNEMGKCIISLKAEQNMAMLLQQEKIHSNHSQQVKQPTWSSWRRMQEEHIPHLSSNEDQKGRKFRFDDDNVLKDLETHFMTGNRLCSAQLCHIEFKDLERKRVIDKFSALGNEVDFDSHEGSIKMETNSHCLLVQKILTSFDFQIEGKSGMAHRFWMQLFHPVKDLPEHGDEQVFTRYQELSVGSFRSPHHFSKRWLLQKSSEESQDQRNSEESQDHIIRLNTKENGIEVDLEITLNEFFQIPYTFIDEKVIFSVEEPSRQGNKVLVLYVPLKYSPFVQTSEESQRLVGTGSPKTREFGQVIGECLNLRFELTEVEDHSTLDFFFKSCWKLQHQLAISIFHAKITCVEELCQDLWTGCDFFSSPKLFSMAVKNKDLFDYLVSSEVQSDFGLLKRKATYALQCFLAKHLNCIDAGQGGEVEALVTEIQTCLVHSPFMANYPVELQLTILEKTFYEMESRGKEDFFEKSVDLFKAVVETTALVGKQHDPSITALTFQRILPEHHVFIKRAMITPTQIIPLPMDIILGNRVSRTFGEENFIIVKFRDEAKQNLHSAGSSDLFQHFEDIKNNGFSLCGELYRFVGNSNSQQRENACWFYNGDPKEVISWVFPGSDISRGELPHGITNSSKYLSRLGLFFSSSYPALEVNPSCMDDANLLPDVFTKDVNQKYCFSDGIGFMTEEFLDLVQKSCPELNKDASALQIRLGGCKGMVSILTKDAFEALQRSEILPNDLPYDQGIFLRPSMKKFESSHCILEIVDWNRCNDLYLNRQAIQLLSCDGLKDDVLFDLQKKQLDELVKMLHDEKANLKVMAHEMPSHLNLQAIKSAGVNIIEEPFLRSLSCVVAHRQNYELVHKARIRVPEGRVLKGVMDETSQLEDGEVYISFRDKDGSVTNISGYVLVYKNPVLHPGEIKKLWAMPAGSFEIDMGFYENCIVFPQKGKRPHANECSGSDLDGDEYSIIWDRRFTRSVECTTESPDSIAASPLKIEKAFLQDLCHQYRITMENQDNLGKLANMHLALCDKLDPKHDHCKKLAELHLVEVDFPKTGVSGVELLSRLDFASELQVRERPDFMESKGRNTYESQKVLGKLYRASLEQVGVIMGKNQSLYRRISNDITNSSWILGDHFDTQDQEKEMSAYLAYRNKIRGLLKRMGIQSEAEILTASIIDVAAEMTENLADLRFSMSRTYAAIQQQLSSEFWSVFGHQLNIDHCDPCLKRDIHTKISLWYTLAYNDNECPGIALGFVWTVPDAFLNLIHCQKKEEPDSLGASSSNQSGSKIGNQLSQQMASFLKKQASSMRQEYADRKMQAYKIMSCIGQIPELHWLGERTAPNIFGSSALLLFCPASDIDLFLDLNLQSTSSDESNRKLQAEKLQIVQRGIQSVFSPVDIHIRARVPILRYTPSNTVAGSPSTAENDRARCAHSPLPSDVAGLEGSASDKTEEHSIVGPRSFDICLDPGGSLKTQFLLRLFVRHPPFFLLAFCTTQFARHAGLIRNNGGSLNVFGLVWWLLDYCVKSNILSEEDKTIDPDRDLALDECYEQLQQSMIELMLEHDWSEMQCNFSSSSQNENNNCSVGKVLIGFLEHISSLNTEEGFELASPGDLPGGDEYSIVLGQEEVLQLKNLKHQFLGSLLLGVSSYDGNCFEDSLYMFSKRIIDVPKGISQQLFKAKEYYEVRLAATSGCKVKIQQKGVFLSKTQTVVQAEGEDHGQLERFKDELEKIKFQILNAPVAKDDEQHVENASLLLFEGNCDPSERVLFPHYIPLESNPNSQKRQFDAYHAHHEGRAFYEIKLCRYMQQTEESTWQEANYVMFQAHLMGQLEMLGAYLETHAKNPLNGKTLSDLDNHEFCATIRVGKFYLMDLPDTFRGASAGLYNVENIVDCLLKFTKSMYRPETVDEMETVHQDGIEEGHGNDSSDEESTDDSKTQVPASGSSRKCIQRKMAPFEAAKKYRRSEKQKRTLVGLPSSFFTFVPTKKAGMVSTVIHQLCTLGAERNCLPTTDPVSSYSLTFRRESSGKQYKISLDDNFVVKKVQMRAVRWSATTLIASPLDIRWYMNMFCSPDQEFLEEVTAFSSRARLVTVKQDGKAGTSSQNLVLNQDFFSLNEVKSATLRQSRNTTYDILGKEAGCFCAVFSEVTEYQFASADGVFQTSRSRNEFDLYSKNLPISGLGGRDPRKTSTLTVASFVRGFWDLGMEALRSLKLCRLEQKS